MKRLRTNKGELIVDIALCATLVSLGGGLLLYSKKCDNDWHRFVQEHDLVLLDYEFSEEDTIESICERFGISKQALYLYNDGMNENSFLIPGMIIQIPQYVEKENVAKKLL